MVRGRNDEGRWHIVHHRGMGRDWREARVRLGKGWTAHGLALIPGGWDYGLVAVSPDRRFVAAAVADGTIEVWSALDGHRVAHLRGHHARVAWLGFAAGALWSAGWDGAVLRWDLTALTASAAALVADAAAAWALPPIDRGAP